MTKKFVLAGFVVGLLLSLAGCSGEVSAQEQKEKKDSLQKFADSHADPNEQKRPDR